jgi:Brp/Blh family beta-carotene 15,15'-monooxygenase
LTSLLRLQGLIFCYTAVACAVFTPLLRQLDANLELAGMAALVLALGVPHGALDTVFAKHLYKVTGFREWLLFGAIYSIPTAAVVGLWFEAPLGFLVGFLSVSALHFSADPNPGTPRIARIFYGGAIIVLPSLFHAQEASRLFALLIGAASAETVTVSLHAAAWPWLVSTLIAASYRLMTDRLSAAEIAATALLATIAPPLIAFTVFFCLMHSARHVLRTVGYFADVSPRLILSAGAASMLGTLGLAAVAWFWLGHGAPDERLMRLVFVGLAALTIPHMGVVERVRLTGWKREGLLNDRAEVV